ncbi:hypothetical protein FOA43_000030 [Brettanomyces nanus]|uniref:ATPase expression protein 2, mitochondrial n=1 Tax=Eeniella nana TaxID=13502 RepID=A0A875RYH8_EENNA|nr:uncharacterized protein FOA43_000030 [Brettanomyces nanus]QPG72729.1 hypothetical protein FOA43_000030 [Brettanomyces nanus]
MLTRLYSKSRRFARLDKESNATLLTYHDLELFERYLKGTDFAAPQTKHDKEDAGHSNRHFEFTGRQLSRLISNTMSPFSSSQGTAATVNENDLDVKHGNLHGLNEKQWITISKIKLCLKSADDEALYDILKCNQNVIPTLVERLSPFQTSLLIKRLTDYQIAISKQFTVEQKYSSRLHSDSNMRGLVQMKDKTYQGVRSILRKIGRNHHLNNLDYETIVSFCMGNLRYRDAIEFICEMETKIRQGDTSLKLRNSLWADKISILCRSTEKTWSLGRYDLKSNRAQILPEDYSYPLLNGRGVATLVKQYEDSNLIPDRRVYEALILASGKSKEMSQLDSLILNVWGVNAKTGEMVEGFQIPKKNSLDYPNFDILRSIVLAYTYNSELVKPLSVCNTIIENYDLDSIRSQKYWETVLQCTALQCENVYREIQTKLWKAGADKDEYSCEMLLSEDIFDEMWEHIIKIVQKPSKSMVRLRLSYASLKALLRDLPKIHQRSVDPAVNITASEAAYNENLLFSYLNVCRIRLMKLRKFYQTEDMINRFSINKQMKQTLLRRLNSYQQRYLKRVKDKRVLERQRIRDDDDEDSMLGLW